MSTGAVAFLAVVCAVVLVGAGLQVWQYRSRQSLITPAQLVLRLAMALLLLSVVALSAWGLTVQGPGAAAELSRAQQLGFLRGLAFYWTVVIVLVLVAAILALLDLRYVRAAQHRGRAQMYRKLAELQAQLQEQVRAQAEALAEKQKSASDN